MDRGFVFSLIRTYMKDIATKIIQAGSVSNDSAQLWNLQVITLWLLSGQRFQYPYCGNFRELILLPNNFSD